MKKWILISTMLIVALSCMAATTIDPAKNDAYGANIGWVNAVGDTTHGAVIGQAFCSGYLYSANCGWISLGDGSPDDGQAYANDSASDFGVNHDGQGNLSGYAYGANIGWVNFEQTHGQPNVNLETGELGGYAYGANVGWISLDSGVYGVRTLTLDSGPDIDEDGIPDAWEYEHTNVLTVLAGGGTDSDGDGISDIDEYGSDTDPFDPDDYLCITDFEVDASTNRVTWTCVPTRRYTLQHGAALSNGMVWVDTGSSVVPPSGSEMTEEVNGVIDISRFYRVRVDLPLSP